MPPVRSVMHLHLRYRLWIAEMNADINVLRILNDYIPELEAQKNNQLVAKGIDHFKQQFTVFKNELDELRHEMLLLKMKLAATARENKKLDRKTSREDNHKGLKKRYAAFRRSFTRLKKEFSLFEAKWLG